MNRGAATSDDRAADQSARVLLILPGLGGSPGEWAGATDALGRPVQIGGVLPPTGSAVVIGHSLGAVQALNTAVAHPDRVEGVVLTGAFFPPARVAAAASSPPSSTISDTARPTFAM
jgi:pimeloyl-ACP methyl ester carboxylesterase